MNYDVILLVVLVAGVAAIEYILLSGHERREAERRDNREGRK